MAEEKEFKVTDRRASSGNLGGSEKKSRGEDFTMKSAPQEESQPQQIDFSALILSLATSAMINMGIAPDPTTKKTVKNLEIARQNIDILGMLESKTKGNLTPDEAKLLENILSEVRLRFVDASKN